RLGRGGGGGVAGPGRALLVQRRIGRRGIHGGQRWLLGNGGGLGDGGGAAEHLVEIDIALAPGPEAGAADPGEQQREDDEEDGETRSGARLGAGRRKAGVVAGFLAIEGRGGLALGQGRRGFAPGLAVQGLYGALDGAFRLAGVVFLQVHFADAGKGGLDRLDRRVRLGLGRWP